MKKFKILIEFHEFLKEKGEFSNRIPWILKRERGNIMSWHRWIWKKGAQQS